MTEKNGGVLRRAHGFQLDHIALAVSDTQYGVDVVARATGVQPTLLPPHEGSWFHSGALALGDGSFLEIIGPNPAHRGLHPMKGILRAYREPSLLFWYIATDHFDTYAKRIVANGGRVDQKFAVDTDRGAYTACVIGPGFWSQRPCVIEWRRHPDQDMDIEQSCKITGFALAHPKADALNAQFRALDIDPIVTKGPSRLALQLDTPNGRVEFTGAGTRQTPWTMASALLREMFGGR